MPHSHFIIHCHKTIMQTSEVRAVLALFKVDSEMSPGYTS